MMNLFLSINNELVEFYTTVLMIVYCFHDHRWDFSKVFKRISLLSFMFKRSALYAVFCSSLFFFLWRKLGKCTVISPRELSFITYGLNFFPTTRFDAAKIRQQKRHNQLGCLIFFHQYTSRATWVFRAFLSMFN